MSNSGPGYTLTFLYYFCLTCLIALLVGSQGLRLAWNDRNLYQAAIAVGLLIASITAYWNHTVVVMLPVSQPTQFSRRLGSVLQDMGVYRISIR
jgi:hypothetical protein